MSVFKGIFAACAIPVAVIGYFDVRPQPYVYYQRPRSFDRKPMKGEIGIGNRGFWPMFIHELYFTKNGDRVSIKDMENDINARIVVSENYTQPDVITRHAKNTAVISVYSHNPCDDETELNTHIRNVMRPNQYQLHVRYGWFREESKWLEKSNTVSYYESFDFMKEDSYEGN